MFTMKMAILIVDGFLFGWNIVSYYQKTKQHTGNTYLNAALACGGLALAVVVSFM